MKREYRVFTNFYGKGQTQFTGSEEACLRFIRNYKTRNRGTIEVQVWDYELSGWYLSKEDLWLLG